MTEKEQTFAVVYRVESLEEPKTAAQIAEEFGDRFGGADSILMVSIIHCDEQKEMLDGATSTMVFGENGRTDQPLGADEIFQIWTGLSHHLAQSLPEDNRKALCEDVNVAVKAMVTSVDHDTLKN